MAIPKGLLQIAMQSTRVLKPDETVLLTDFESELVKETNNSKLTFRRGSTVSIDKLNNDQSNINTSIITDTAIPASSESSQETALRSIISDKSSGSFTQKGSRDDFTCSVQKLQGTTVAPPPPPPPPPPPHVVMLTGSEKKIIIHLCEKKEKQDNGKLITKVIHLSIVSQEIGIPITTIKKSIQRLERKGFLNRVTFKPGREGWTIYSIPLSILKELL